VNPNAFAVMGLVHKKSICLMRATLTSLKKGYSFLLRRLVMVQSARPVGPLPAPCRASCFKHPE
jgi:hypothetical protein